MTVGYEGVEPTFTSDVSPTAELALVKAELADLRASLDAKLDSEPAALQADDRRASRYWFALWQHANRKRAELALRVDKLTAQLDEVAAEAQEARRGVGR